MLNAEQLLSQAALHNFGITILMSPGTLFSSNVQKNTHVVDWKLVIGWTDDLSGVCVFLPPHLGLESAP